MIDTLIVRAVGVRIYLQRALPKGSVGYCHDQFALANDCFTTSITHPQSPFVRRPDRIPCAHPRAELIPPPSQTDCRAARCFCAGSRNRTPKALRVGLRDQEEPASPPRGVHFRWRIFLHWRSRDADPILSVYEGARMRSPRSAVATAAKRLVAILYTY